MTPAATPLPPDSAMPWPQRAGWFIAALALAAWFFNPTSAVLDMTLDMSNYSSYTHFTAQGFHFGRDVVPMVGPYGFINYGFAYNGELFGLRLLLEFALKAALGGLVLWFFRAAGRGLLRWVWLGAVLFAVPMIEDTSYDLGILLAGWFLLLRFDRSRTALAPCLVAALLALLSLCKGTQVTLALVTLGLVVVQALLARQIRRGLAVLGAFAGAYLALWLLAGQSPADIPGFLRGIQELSSGYNAAMGLDEAPAVTVAGLVLGGLLVAATLWAAGIGRAHRPLLFAAAFFAAFALVQWKHGYVRADGHVFIYFHFVVIGALMPVLLLSAHGVTLTWNRWFNNALACATLAVGWYQSFHHVPTRTWLAVLRDSFSVKVTQLSHPVAAQTALAAQLEHNRQKFALPLLRERIGAGSVDLFGSEHGFIPLNRLRYHPRPVGGGSFNVYTEYLKRLNEAFLLDPQRRPDFYLVKGQTLDHRLLSQDDSRALLPLLFLYHPVASERDLILLARNPAAAPPPAPVVLARRKFHWGETVAVPALPAGSSDLLLVSFEFPPTLLGRLRAFFYKPPQIQLRLAGDAEATRDGVRIIPEMTRSPVILNPLLDNSLDLLSLYSDLPGKQVREFTAGSSHAGLFRGEELAVTFYRLPRPPADPAFAALAAATRMAVANAPVELADPVTFPHYMPDGFVVGMHAPSRAVMTLDGSERELLLEFGIEPGAYSPGQTDGVDFIVELTQPGLPLQLLFHRYLDPVAAPGDRGTQSHRVILPPLHPGAKAVLRTHPGPRNNIGWDWAYFAKVEFNRGGLTLAQFPGFNRPPSAVEAEYSGVQDIGDRSVFMLNAPGALRFTLDGREVRLRFAGGILPGAYTGDGHSDGATFIAELVAADGPRREVFRRTLNPRGVEGDRGLQQFVADLPPHPAGTQLVVRTDPGPAGDKSWDWSFVADLKFE